MIPHRFVLAITMLLITCYEARAAELHLPAIFADHMILQREQTIPVWGWADAGTKITVQFAGQTKSVVADDSGKWIVNLDRMQASSEPRTLTK